MSLPNRQLPVLADPVRAYMARIGEHPLLTAEEEQELAHRWADERDVEAARRLVLSNLRFVVKIANGYRRYGLRPMDLIQEGNLGLMVAVRRFDPRRGIRLLSYAVHWIRAYIMSFIMRSWRLVRLGTTRAQRKLFYKLRETQRRLKQAEGREDAATPAAVGRALGVSRHEVVEMDRLLAGRDLSLDAPARSGEGDDARVVGEVMASPDPDPEELVSRGQHAALRRHRIDAALDVLQPREREIIRRRYLSETPVSLAELGREQGLSRERIRQLEARAMKKLRATLEHDAPELIDLEPPAPDAVPAAA